LKKLNCSNNQLVYLDLTDCTDLIDFKCDNNEFRKLDFLKSLSNLEKLWIQNNSKLFNKNLSFFTPFKKLKELDVSNCPFEGSLKPLENLYKLERISISFTDISEGLEDLPENCKEIYCELDYNSKAMEIIKELGKLTKEENTN
jgi:Leucine-rich repeat (LRR) protein